MCLFVNTKCRCLIWDFHVCHFGRARVESLSSACWRLRRATHAVATARSSVLIRDAMSYWLKLWLKMTTLIAVDSLHFILKIHGNCGFAWFVEIGRATICKRGFKLQNCSWAMWRAWGALPPSGLASCFLINPCHEQFAFFFLIKERKELLGKVTSKHTIVMLMPRILS